MADQVRVAADRRREVAVARRPQAVVTEVAGRVAGLLQGAQDERGEADPAVAAAAHLLVDVVRDLRRQVARLLRRERPRERRRGDVERVELRDQPFDPRWIRPLVDAVQGGELARLQEPRDGLVGGDHQVLDQPVRLGLLARLERAHVTVAVERELRLGRLDGQRAALVAGALQRRADCACRGQGLGPRRLRRLGTREDPVHARIVEPRVGADHGAVKRGAAHRRALELQLDGDGQPILARHQRARAVGQRLRQHRLDQAGDVDAVGAPERLAVDGSAGADERGDVGDVDPHAYGAVVELLGRDRVVEVLRRRRIDGERRQVAEVACGSRRPGSLRPRSAPRAPPADRSGAAARGRASAPRARRARRRGGRAAARPCRARHACRPAARRPDRRARPRAACRA